MNTCTHAHITRGWVWRSLSSGYASDVGLQPSSFESRGARAED